MTGLGALIRRDMKLYFKDKGMFFSSLITPILLLVLYTTFLKKVFDDSFRSALEAAGATVADSVLNGVVGGQLISSLLAVSCVTVAFCSNLLMIKDKTSGARHDLTISPVRPSTMAIHCLVSFYSQSAKLQKFHKTQKAVCHINKADGFLIISIKLSYRFISTFLSGCCLVLSKSSDWYFTLEKSISARSKYLISLLNMVR